MISGTSKILTKYGPVDPLIITKNDSKIQEDVGSSWKNIIFASMGINIFENVRKSMYRVVVVVFGFRFCFGPVRLTFFFFLGGPMSTEAGLRKRFCGFFVRFGFFFGMKNGLHEG